MFKRDRMYIENRLDSLRRDPVSNAKLIKKWERILRKFDREGNI